MGLWLEAGAMAFISALAVLGNLLVVSTLLRRSLLHHPSNRLVLSLTGSNLVLVGIVLPGMVTSVLLGPSDPISNTYTNSNTSNTSSADIRSVSIVTDLHRIADSNHSIESSSLLLDSSNNSSASFIQSRFNDRTLSSSKQVSQDMYQIDFQGKSLQKDYPVREFSNEEISYTRSEEISYIGRKDIIVISDGTQLERLVGEDYEGVNYISDGTNNRGRTFVTDSQYESKVESSGGSFGLCQASAFLTNLVTSASALTVAVIALDRYLAIVRPMVYGLMVTGGRCVILLAWCWGQALLTAIPPLLGWARYERLGEEGWCGVAWSSTPSYTAFWVLTIVLMPIIIMVACYYFILQVARNKCRRIHVGILGGTPPPTPETASGAATEVTHQKRSLDNQMVENHNEVFIDPDVVGQLYKERERSKSLATTNGMTINKISEPSTGRSLGDYGRSASFCQHQAPPPRPCLRRVQSSVTMRPSLRQKFSRASRSSRGGRKPSWSWEASPAKGVRTVLVVVGTHVLTWLPYSLVAVAEAALGSDRSNMIPRWTRVSSLLLLFLASVFYPIVYGLYNRSIRKEVRYCLCPGSRKMKHHNGPRRPSQAHSITGSVLDFSSLRMRSFEESYNTVGSSVPGGQIASNISASATVNTICGGLPTPSVISSGAILPPLLLLAAQEALAPVGCHIKSSRKPSQDSGAVMGCSDELECDAFYCAPLSHQLSRHKYSTSLSHSSSAPCFLSLYDDTTHLGEHCGEQYVGLTPSEASSSLEDVHTRMGSTRQRKLTSILPLSPQLLIRAKTGEVQMRKTISCENLNGKLSETENSISFNQIKPCRVSNRTLRTKYSLGSGMPKEVQFAGGERIQRRRGSIVTIPTQTVIPEDSGILEDPDFSATEERRKIVADDVNKVDATRQISIDEGIGTDCIGEDDDGIGVSY